MLSPELKNKIADYVGSTITLEQFEDWIVPRLRGYLRNLGTTDSNAVSAIELGLSEMSAGLKNEVEFRSDLEKITRNAISELAFNTPMPLTVSGSINKTEKFPDKFVSLVTAGAGRVL